MNVQVCLKVTLDPEIPSKDFRIDPVSKRPIKGNAKMVLDSYAENALEVAIKLKEQTGCEVSAICVGDNSSDEGLRRALAFTANQAVRVWDSSYSELDANNVAHLLAQTIKNSGNADMVLVGRQAADIERGSVGPMLAEELGFPCVTFVTKVEQIGQRVRLTREVQGGFEVVECSLPVVITVNSHESNVPRVPKVKDTMAAARKPIEVKTAQDINPEQSQLKPTVIIEDVYVPQEEVNCEIISGDDGVALAANLISKLKENKLF